MSLYLAGTVFSNQGNFETGFPVAQGVLEPTLPVSTSPGLGPQVGTMITHAF